MWEIKSKLAMSDDEKQKRELFNPRTHEIIEEISKVLLFGFVMSIIVIILSVCLL